MINFKFQTNMNSNRLNFKKLTVIVLCFAVATVFSGCGEDEFFPKRDVNVNGIRYDFDDEGNTAMVRGSNMDGKNFYNGDVVVPSTVQYAKKTYTVTAVEAHTFSSRGGITCDVTSVVIPNTVTEIGSAAFQSAVLLTSVVLSNSLTAIESYTFDGCRSLETVGIPNSVTSIGNRAFWGCGQLKTVTLGSSLTEIGKEAFQGCDQLISVDIPDLVKTIGEGAFSQINDLAEMRLGSSVETIGAFAFSLTKIQSVVCPNSLKTIGNNAFDNTPLKSLTLNDGLETVGYRAFYGCEVESLDIPKSIKSIAEQAFYGNLKLGSVVVHWETPLEINSDVFLFGYGATLVVPAGTSSLYKAATGWKSFKNIVEN